MIEPLVLTAVTAWLIGYSVAAVAAWWAHRPLVGRWDDGCPRPAREVRRKQ